MCQPILDNTIHHCHVVIQRTWHVSPDEKTVNRDRIFAYYHRPILVENWSMKELNLGGLVWRLQLLSTLPLWRISVCFTRIFQMIFYDFQFDSLKSVIGLLLTQSLFLLLFSPQLLAFFASISFCFSNIIYFLFFSLLFATQNDTFSHFTRPSWHYCFCFSFFILFFASSFNNIHEQTIW